MTVGQKCGRCAHSDLQVAMEGESKFLSKVMVFIMHISNGWTNNPANPCYTILGEESPWERFFSPLRIPFILLNTSH